MLTLTHSLLLPLLSLPLTLSFPAPFPAPDNSISVGPMGIATVDTGISMTMYSKPSCGKNSAVNTVDLQYYTPVVQQFHSYKLNGTFTDQTVGIYKTGGASGCAEFVYNLADKMMTEGCHSFDTDMGCMEVQLS